MRLDQYLSQSLNISRSQAKLLIKQQCIRLDEAICTQAKQSVDGQSVYYQEQLVLPAAEQLYFVLNKPCDYVCSHHDDGYPSALNLLPSSHKKLLFAGRLDAQTSGLVLISTNGQWCHRVSSPNFTKTKSYQVTLDKTPAPLAIAQLEQGIMLRSESKPTAPCRIQPIDQTHYLIELHEGKYHQVRRMFAAIGCHVIALHRFAVGPINLNNDTLAAGQFRPLTQQEIDYFL